MRCILWEACGGHSNHHPIAQDVQRKSQGVFFTPILSWTLLWHRYGRYQNSQIRGFRVVQLHDFYSSHCKRLCFCGWLKPQLISSVPMTSQIPGANEVFEFLLADPPEEMCSVWKSQRCFSRGFHSAPGSTQRPCVDFPTGALGTKKIWRDIHPMTCLLFCWCFKWTGVSCSFWCFMRFFGHSFLWLVGFSLFWRHPRTWI